MSRRRWALVAGLVSLVVLVGGLVTWRSSQGGVRVTLDGKPIELGNSVLCDGSADVQRVVVTGDGKPGLLLTIPAQGPYLLSFKTPEGLDIWRTDARPITEQTGRHVVIRGEVEERQNNRILRTRQLALEVTCPW